MNTLLLEGSTRSYKQDAFCDLYIRVVDDKFVIGIYHKIDYSNFEVINYPFPQSNIHSMLGYTTFYLQLTRFFILGNNINYFLIWQNLVILSWTNVATYIASCLNISKGSV